MTTTFRIGQPGKSWRGLRIATARRPPRGVAKTKWRQVGHFDLWLPTVAPSPALLRRVRAWDFDNPRHLAQFFAAYKREMSAPDARHTIELLAAIAQRLPLAIGCYCEDEARCHRSVLKRLIDAA